MKKSITCLFSIFMVILFICSLATIIQAAPTVTEGELTYTAEKDGVILSATIDKTLYDEDENIRISYSVDNTNDFSVYQYMSVGNSWNIDLYVVPNDEPENKIDCFVWGSAGVNINKELEAGAKKEYKDITTRFPYDQSLPAGEYTVILSTNYGFDIPPETYPADYEEKEVTLFFDITIKEKKNYQTSDEDVSLFLDFDKKIFSDSENINFNLYAQNIGTNEIYQHRLITNSAWDFDVTVSCLSGPSNPSVTIEDLHNHAGGAASSINQLKPSESTPIAEMLANKPLPIGKYLLTARFKYTTNDLGEYEEISLSKNTKAITLTASFEVTNILPSDLAVSAVAANSVAPEEGEAIKLNATVRNYGEKKYEGDVTVNFYKNGILISTVSQTVELTPGGYTVIASDKAAEFAFGLQTIYADISCDDLHEDTDSDNNIVKSRVVVE